MLKWLFGSRNDEGGDEDDSDLVTAGELCGDDDDMLEYVNDCADVDVLLEAGAHDEDVFQWWEDWAHFRRY